MISSKNQTNPFLQSDANTGLFKPSSAIISDGLRLILIFCMETEPFLIVLTAALGSSALPMQDDK